MSPALPPSSRGTLFPGRLPPRFRRVPAGEDAAECVAWWWISEWSLPPGETSTQHLLAFPASNLAVETDLVGYAGPTTRASSRILTGSGWVLGALLRPAAVPAFTADPARLRDSYVPLDDPAAIDLHAAVAAFVDDDLAGAIPTVTTWIARRVGPLTEDARLANRMVDVAGADADVTTVADLAARLHVSERTLHRLAARYVGLTPHAILRRRRLQEAAQAVRDEPDRPLADIATAHGFVDQAHLTREFRRLLGRSPAAYRAEAGGATGVEDRDDQPGRA